VRLSELTRSWLETASVFRAHTEEPVARAYEHCAEALGAVLEDEQEHLLTLQEAAGESNYSVDHLGRQVREGKIPNSGRPGAPRIARRHLPRKPGVVAPPRSRDQLDRAQIVRSAIDAGD